jgi:hypothetical protein
MILLWKDVTGYVTRLEGSRDNCSQGNTKVQRFINDAPTAMLVSLFCDSRQRIFETPSLRCEAFGLRYENDMKKGSAFILSSE